MSHSAFWTFQSSPPGDHVVSIGTFDGVHLGHQYLLRSARLRSDELGLPLLAVTFEPNPAQVIRPEGFLGRISTASEKLSRLWDAGVADVVVVPFTREVMMESPETFLGHLVDSTRPREVWVGEAFALGHKRAGDLSRLREIGRSLGFDLVAVPRREYLDQVVSSSQIRRFVTSGSVLEASRFLGYPYRISGEVVQGAQVGRTIGFPTANIDPPSEKAPVPDGIYASLATIDGHSAAHLAMTYVGTRPALNTGARQIETHVLDFSEDLYGRVLHTDFIDRLRPDSDFPSVEALVAQLAKDEIAARKVLASIR